MKPIVLCDMDGICADLLTEWLRRYNEDRHHEARQPLDVKPITIADITKFDIHECVPHGRAIYDYIRQPGLFPAIEPIAGAVEGLKEINSISELFICSTPSKLAQSAAEKLEWCARYLPFIDRRNIILCARKDLVFGHILIDDSPEHLTRPLVGGTHRAFTATITYPYNKDVVVDCRGEDWRTPEKAWATIVDFVKAEALEWHD